MNILIPPIVNMPRVCDECPEDLCLIGYTHRLARVSVTILILRASRFTIRMSVQAHLP